MTNSISKLFRATEIKAPGILERQSVHEPLITGVLAIDSMIPLGRGQRELIIGDRGIGKTAIAIDTIANQFHQNLLNPEKTVYCVYVAIGQKRSSIIQVLSRLEAENALQYTTIVAATSSDSAMRPWPGTSSTWSRSPFPVMALATLLLWQTTKGSLDCLSQPV